MARASKAIACLRAIVTKATTAIFAIRTSTSAPRGQGPVKMAAFAPIFLAVTNALARLDLRAKIASWIRTSVRRTRACTTALA